MATDFEDILAASSPTQAPGAGGTPFDDVLYPPTPVVEYQRSPFDDIFFKPVQASAEKLHSVMKGIGEDVLRHPVLKEVYGLAEKNVVKPIKFAADKALEAAKLPAQGAGKALDMFLHVVNKIDEQTIGRAISSAVKEGYDPQTAFIKAPIPGFPPRPDLAAAMGPTPGVLDAMKVLSPEIERWTQETFGTGPKGESRISQVISPLLESKGPESNAFSALNMPIKATMPGLMDAGRKVMETLTNVKDADSAAAKFFLGAGLTALSPSNLALGAGAKGVSAALKTPMATEMMSKTADMLLGALKDLPGGDDIMRGLQLGEYKMPAVLEELFDDRARRIASAEYRGLKLIDEEILTLSPAERLRVGQIRKGSISMGGPGGNEKLTELKRKEQAFGSFIDTLSKRILTENENAIKAGGQGLFPDEMAEIIKNNIGEYMPRDYSLFHEPLKDGHIPSTFLDDLWSMDDTRMASIEKLSPKAAQDIYNHTQRVQMRTMPDSSGFKPMRIKQTRFKSRMEADRAAQLFERISDEQDTLRGTVKDFNLNALGFSDQEVGLLNKSGVTLEELASVKKEGWGSGDKWIRSRISDALGKDISIEKARKLIETSAETLDGRNKLHGKIGDLEFKKTPEMLKFQSEAKFGIQDLADSKQDPRILAQDLSSMLGRSVKKEEALEMQSRAKAFTQGLIPEEALGEERFATFDFEQYQHALGKIDDPAVLGAKAIRDLTVSGENARLFNIIATKPEWALPEEVITGKAGYIKLPDTKTLGPLAGRYVKSQIYDEIQNITNFQKRFDSSFTKAMTTWKFGKTALNPSSHFRNLMSNVIMADASGMNWARQSEMMPRAIDALIERKGLYTRAIKDGAISGSFADSELKGLMDDLIKTQTEGGTIAEWTAKAAGTVANPAGSIYQSEEELFKMMKYIDELDKGKSGLDAAKEAQKWMFNYNKVPPAIREMRKNPLGMPFITYPYKALPRIAESLKDNPMRLLKYEYLFRTIEAGSAATQGVTPEIMDGQKEIAKKGSPLFTRFLRLPYTNPNGHPFFLDLTYILPWGDIGEFGSFLGAPSAVVPGGLLKPVAEVIFNQSLYSGKPIWGNKERFPSAKEGFEKPMTDDEGHLIGQQIASHLIKSYMPSLTPGIPGTKVEGGFSYERIKRALKQQPVSMSEKEPQPYVSAAMDTLFGLKTRAQDLDEVKMIRIQNVERDMQTIDDEIKEAARKMAFGVIPKEEFEQLLQIKTQARLMLADEIIKTATMEINAPQ